VRNQQSTSVGLVLLAALSLIASACAPTAPPSAPSSSRPAGDPGTQAQSSQPTGAPKTLIVGQGYEMQGLNRVGANDAELGHVINAGLVTRDPDQYVVLPWMAEALPSLDNGTWVVTPNGMTTTWRVRDNIKWHDGTPFKTSDFVFGWQVFNDNKVALDARGFADLIDRIETPDDRSLVIHWKSRLYLGNQLFFSYLMPLPSHILAEPLRAGDYEAFNNLPYWTNQLVHLGPYRVTEFVQGSHVDLQAFDGYFLGRPKIDRIIWRIISDSNALLANVMANEVDVTTRAALTLDTALVAEAQWANRGEGTVKYAPTNWTWLNPSATSPIFGWDAPNQNLVRQALIHSINRVEIAETIGHGKEPLIDFPLGVSRPQFRAADAAVKKYPYDVRRAEQLMNDAGWRKGSDGILVNDRGERFSVEFRAQRRADLQQLQGSIADYFKALGVDTQQVVMASAQANSPENRNRWPGFWVASHNIQAEDWKDRYHTVNTPNEGNNWIGNNVAAWRTPAKDQIIDRFFDELNAQRQSDVMVEFLKMFSEELPHLPLKYNAEVTSWRNNIKGVSIRNETGGENARTWNIHLWEKN
jgi:peptide/nickel transport system substrate-binding protein